MNDTGIDPLYDDAKKLVEHAQSVSISMLQRELQIGFRRACHLLDLLQADVNEEKR